MPRRQKPSAPDAKECFLAFELAERSSADLDPSLVAAHQALVGIGWPAVLVRPEKRHASLLYFAGLSQTERAAVWTEVEAAKDRGAWKDPGFQWRGLEFWPNASVVVLPSGSYNALERWGLESWSDHPICRTGELKALRRYTPHFTVLRLKGDASKTVRNQRADGWRRIQEQLEPIDLERITVDRITFFLIDYSRGYHRYIRENSIEIL